MEIIGCMIIAISLSSKHPRGCHIEVNLRLNRQFTANIILACCPRLYELLLSRRHLYYILLDSSYTRVA